MGDEEFYSEHLVNQYLALQTNPSKKIEKWSFWKFLNYFQIQSQLEKIKNLARLIKKVDEIFSKNGTEVKLSK